jgi:hypothetical protein
MNADTRRGTERPGDLRRILAEDTVNLSGYVAYCMRAFEPILSPDLQVVGTTLIMPIVTPSGLLIATLGVAICGANRTECSPKESDVAISSSAWSACDTVAPPEPPPLPCKGKADLRAAA